jgi:hypothetical protein
MRTPISLRRRPTSLAMTPNTPTPPSSDAMTAKADSTNAVNRSDASVTSTAAAIDSTWYSGTPGAIAATSERSIGTIAVGSPLARTTRSRVPLGNRALDK